MGFLFSLLFLLFAAPLWADETVVDEWAGIRAPEAPLLQSVKVDPKITALLVLDIEQRTCNLERRPRCIASVLGKILSDRGIKTVIIVGTAANGAVLGTAIGAAMRKLNIIVPVDGMSDAPYSEQYVAWHLVNAPGTRNRTTLTAVDLIEF